jgi:uncharacterized membrane protein YfcA
MRPSALPRNHGQGGLNGPAPAGLAGALLGAQLAKQVDGDALLMWFAVAMIAIAGSMLIPKKSDGDPAVRLTPPMVLKLAPVGLIAGLAAGFFGIGGGFLIAPGLGVYRHDARQCWRILFGLGQLIWWRN